MCVYSIEMAPGPSRTEHMPNRMRKGYTSIRLEKRYSADIEHSAQTHLGQTSFICLWRKKRKIKKNMQIRN